MAYQIKDYHGNLISEFETYDELDTFISSSQTTSSLDGQVELTLQYFVNDVDLLENLYSGSILFPENFSTSDLEFIRIIYQTEEGEDI
jgi:hypothetical protein